MAAVLVIFNSVLNILNKLQDLRDSYSDAYRMFSGINGSLTVMMEFMASRIGEHNEINSRQLGGPADRAVIARYCLKDCELVNRLAEDLRVVVNGMGLANMTFVPLPFIYIRGQGIKIYSRVARECQARRNVIVDHDDADEDADAAEEDSYEGATVQPPVAGMHENVMCVDFASLYPSLMIALALCMSTLHDPEMLPWVPDADWAPLTDPDNEVNTVQFDVIQGRGAKRRRLREERCDFVVRKPREGDPSPWRGMLPEFLKTMLEERAKTPLEKQVSTTV